MKKILITGASDGIGLDTAKLLSEKGHAITLLARNEIKLNNALTKLKGNGHKLIIADLSNRSDVDKLKTVIEQEKFDVLINNAGVGMYGRFSELELTDQVKMMNLNMTALTAISYFYLSQAKAGDTLLNIASTLAKTSFPSAAVYSATKAYVSVFSESLWWEYKKKGINIIGFCPGATKTNFHDVAGGSSNDFPNYVSQESTQVAIEIVNAIEKKKGPSVISGNMNKMMLFFHRLMPRKAVVNMMGGFSTLKNK